MNSVALYVNQEVRGAPNIVQCTAFNPGQNFYGNAVRARSENVDPTAPYAQHTKIIVQTGDPISTGFIPGTLTKSLYGKTEVYNSGADGPLASHSLASFRTEQGTMEGVRARMEKDAKVGKAEDEVLDEVSDVVDSTTRGGKPMAGKGGADTDQDQDRTPPDMKMLPGVNTSGDDVTAERPDTLYTPVATPVSGHDDAPYAEPAVLTSSSYDVGGGDGEPAFNVRHGAPPDPPYDGHYLPDPPYDGHYLPDPFEEHMHHHQRRRHHHAPPQPPAPKPLGFIIYDARAPPIDGKLVVY